jgi:uncharacterized protein YpmS
MTVPDYLMAAPWWHWLFFVLIALCLAIWRPFTINKSTQTHNHEHKHVHTGKES